MTQWIKSACERPLIQNLVLFGVMLSAVLLWQRMGKEEMPDFAMDFLRASVRYPGASAEDVEVLVTRIIEEQLKGLSGLGEVRSTSSYGNVAFRIILEGQGEDTRDTIQAIKDAFARAELPAEVEQPTFSRFTSAEKAIIDIAFYHTGAELLDVKSRRELQEYVLAFESRLLSREEISGVERNGYVKPELQILIHPDRLEKFDISLSDVRQKILNHHIRVPAGTMEDADESEIRVVSELDTPDSLNNLIVRGGFEGNRLKLSQVADVRWDFAKYKTITKVQGHEAIVLNIKKSSNTDILEAQRTVMGFVDSFRSSYPDSPMGIVLMDDESYDVRNRLSIIGWNGLLGFVLIVLVLFIFLDFKSGVWVAMGIPFTLAFTLLCAMGIGYTINNVTLAAIIIVLGIVVDDAIIIAENISRRQSEGKTGLMNVVHATQEVAGPVFASVLTTCAAFLPLYFFSGRFGLFVKYIPAIVFLMLLASLIESLFILPGHMLSPSRLFKVGPNRAGSEHHWMFAVEQRYSRLLAKILGFRWPVVFAFCALLFGSYYLFTEKMKFVMFPREEAKEIAVKVTGPEDTPRLEMAKRVRKIEAMFLEEKGIVTGVLTQVARSRRGGPVKDNEAFIRVELLPPSERSVPLRKLLARWEKQTATMDGFTEVKFLRSRFGSDSGSPIQIEIQENNDESRRGLTSLLQEKMRTLGGLSNVEIERPVSRHEYKATIRQDEIVRLGVDGKALAQALRAYVEGEVLYRIVRGDEEIDVRLTSEEESKAKIESVLALRASNSQNYLVPFSNLVTVTEGRKPANIQRVNFKRTTEIYADLEEGQKITPLEIAEKIESQIFPSAFAAYPTSNILFRGEIEDSRESGGDFQMALLCVLGLIFFLLAVLYNSLSLPLLIACVIPFGVVGVVFAFFGHGMSQFGFFAVIGSLGMIGVVVNDAIVMVSSLQEKVRLGAETMKEDIASVASSRLRAVVVTTLTTVAGLMPTAYGVAGYDSMLAEMMMAMAWGLLFGTTVTLVLLPCVYSLYASLCVRLGRVHP